MSRKLNIVFGNQSVVRLVQDKIEASSSGSHRGNKWTLYTASFKVSIHLCAFSSLPG